MIGNKIRLLEASEIECRVGSIGKNGIVVKMRVSVQKRVLFFFCPFEKNQEG